MSFMGNERPGGGMGGRFGGQGGGRFDGRGDGRFDGGRGNFRDRMDNMGPPMNFDHGFNDPGYFQGPVRGPVPCTFFASAQGCRFGDSCKNIHDSTGNLRPQHSTRPRSHFQKERPVADLYPGSTEEEKKIAMGKRFCYEFKNRGTCARGSDCWYMHKTEAEILLVNATQGPESGPGPLTEEAPERRERRRRSRSRSNSSNGSTGSTGSTGSSDSSSRSSHSHSRSGSRSSRGSRGKKDKERSSHKNDDRGRERERHGQDDALRGQHVSSQQHDDRQGHNSHLNMHINLRNNSQMPQDNKMGAQRHGQGPAQGQAQGHGQGSSFGQGPHNQGPLPGQGTMPGGSVNGNGNGMPFGERNLKGRHCFEMETKGVCFRGDACWYSHDMPSRGGGAGGHGSVHPNVHHNQNHNQGRPFHDNFQGNQMHNDHQQHYPQHHQQQHHQESNGHPTQHPSQTMNQYDKRGVQPFNPSHHVGIQGQNHSPGSVPFDRFNPNGNTRNLQGSGSGPTSFSQRGRPASNAHMDARGVGPGVGPGGSGRGDNFRGSIERERRDVPLVKGPVLSSVVGAVRGSNTTAGWGAGALENERLTQSHGGNYHMSQPTQHQQHSFGGRGAFRPEGQMQGGRGHFNRPLNQGRPYIAEGSQGGGGFRNENFRPAEFQNVGGDRGQRVESQRDQRPSQGEGHGQGGKNIPSGLGEERERWNGGNSSNRRSAEHDSKGEGRMNDERRHEDEVSSNTNNPMSDQGGRKRGRENEVGDGDRAEGNGNDAQSRVRSRSRSRSGSIDAKRNKAEKKRKKEEKKVKKTKSTSGGKGKKENDNDNEEDGRGKDGNE